VRRCLCRRKRATWLLRRTEPEGNSGRTPLPGSTRTGVEKGARLIADALEGHTTGLCRPMYVIDTEKGKIPVTRRPEQPRQRKRGVFVNHMGEGVVYN